MKKVSIIGALFLLPTIVFPKYSKIASEFLENSYEIEQLKLKTIESQYQFNLIEGFYPWSFNTSIYSRESNPDALFDFQARETRTQSFDIGIQRSFDYGTHLDVKHSRIRYDLSQWPSQSIATLGDDQLYETQNTFIIKQNLWNNSFGRSRRLDLSIAGEELNLSQLSIKQEKQQTLFNLYQGYIRSRLSLTLKKLNMDYVLTKEKRLRLIGRKLKDNTVDRIDYYRSKMNLTIAKEKLEESNNNLLEGLSNLSNILDRAFTTSEIAPYNVESINLIPVVKQDINQNYDLKINQLEQNILNQKSKQLSDKSAPNLDLSYSLTQNAIEDSQDQSVIEAFPGRENKEQTIMLEFSTPLGESTAKVEESLNRIQAQRKSIQGIQIKREIENNADLIFKRIESIKQEIELGKERNKFSKLVLSESQKEFNRGRIDLEELLQAEEEVIAANISIIQKLNRYELLVGQYYFLTSKFNQKIAQYQE
ncbi:TolC family protein [Bacteriovoracaceae bacterium]|nr:TolC family protein [Bacteriovoracaceae bacterium]